MKQFQYLLSVAFFVLLAFRPQAQSSDYSLVHFDKAFYVTGEVAWYKLYLTPDFAEKSVSVRVDVADAEGQIIHRHFLKNEGQPFVHGYYQIPFDLNSGTYHLAFTAIAESDKTDIRLATVSFPVYNDLKGATQFADLPQTNAANTKLELNDLQVSIKLQRPTVGRREEVRATVQVVDKAGNPVQGNFSVAVIDQALVETVGFSQTIMPGQNQLDAAALSETLYLKAMLENEGGTPQQANILGAYSHKDQNVFYTKSNAAGEVFLNLPDFHGRKNVQFLGYQKEEERIQAEVKQSMAVPETIPLIFNDALANYLNLSRQRKKIFQHYGILEMNLQAEQYDETATLLAPNQTFEIEEYEYFEKMHNFFKEVLSPLRFQLQSDSTFTARMYDPANKRRNNFFDGKPLFIIDGKVTRDAHYVALMDTDDIEKVELFFNPRQNNSYFRVMGSNGVVRITTKDPLSSLPVFESRNDIRINGLQRAASFPAYGPEQFENNPQQPFFRPQLYWNPVLEIDASGQSDITFYQSDAKSTFRITVVAQSQNGEYGQAMVEYEVQGEER